MNIVWKDINAVEQPGPALDSVSSRVTVLIEDLNQNWLKNYAMQQKGVQIVQHFKSELKILAIVVQ